MTDPTPDQCDPDAAQAESFPRPDTFQVGNGIYIHGRKYTVTLVTLGAGGEPIYRFETADDDLIDVKHTTVQKWLMQETKRKAIEQSIADEEAAAEVAQDRLEQQAESLRGETYSQLFEPLAKLEETVRKMRVELAGTSDDPAALDALEQKIKDLRQETARHLAELKQQVAALVAEEKAAALVSAPAETAPAAAAPEPVEAQGTAAVEEEPNEKGLVDLPAELVQEILDKNPAGIKMALQESIAAVYLPGRDPVAVTNHLKDFLKGIDVDAGGPSLREKLAEAGVKNWEKFRQRFEAGLAEKFAGVLGEMAKSQMGMLLGQEIGAIRELADERHSVFKDIKDATFDFSFLFKMKGSLAAQIVINALLLGGTAVAMNTLLKFLDEDIKATVIGSGVGFMRGLTAWLTGESKTFQGPVAQAKREVEAKKMGLIAETLIKRMFNPDGTVRAAAGNELSHLFATTLRHVTEPEKEKYEITFGKGAPDEFTLKGDAVCMYHEALKRATETEGLEVEEKTRLEFARALHALHNNKGKTTAAAPPALDTGTFSKLIKKIGGATVLGTATGWLIHATTAGRVVVGAVGGLIKENKASAAEDQKAGDRGSRKNLDSITEHIAGLLKKGSAATPDEVVLLREYRALLSALASGQKLEMSLPALDQLKKEKPGVFVKIGRRLKGQKAEPQHVAFDAIEWLRNNAGDVKSFIDRDQSAKMKIDSLQREIARNETKLNFTEALESLKETRQALRGEAENNPNVRRWRKARRMFKYAAIGAGVSLAIGKAGETVWKHIMGGPAAPTPPAGHHEVPAAPAVEAVPAIPAEVTSLLGRGLSKDALAALDNFSHHDLKGTLGNVEHLLAAAGADHDPAILKALNDHLVAVKGDVGKLFDHIVVATDRGHNSITALIQRQLEENPAKYGFKGSTSDVAAFHNWSQRLSAKLAIDEGYIKPDGTQTGLLFKGKEHGFVFLTEEGGQPHIKVVNEVYTIEPPASAAGGGEVKVPSAESHLPGRVSLVEQLRNPMDDPVLRGIAAAKPKIDLMPHLTSGVAASSAVDAAGVDRVMLQLQEQIARQAALHDWAAIKSEDIGEMLKDGDLTDDQLVTWTEEFIKLHPKGQLKNLHEQFEDFIDDKVMPTEPSDVAGGLMAPAEESPAEAVASRTHGGSSIVEEDTKHVPAVSIPAVHPLEALVVSAEHPVAIESQGRDRIVHFFDQGDHKGHVATISETLSPKLLLDKNNPLLIKLTASGHPVPARLEMHLIPGKLDKEPVVVVETPGKGDSTEEVIYRIIGKKLEKFEAPPAS